MTTTKEQKEELRKDIYEMKQGSIEQMLLIIKYALVSYLKSIYTFGKDNRVTRDNLNIIREMFQILRRERTLLNYILRNVDIFDTEAAEEAVGMLDSANDKAIEYYYGLINGIEDAAELDQEYRGYRPRSEEKTLINDGSFIAEVVSLGMGIKEVKEFLSYEDEFWNFLQGKEKMVDSSAEVMEKVAHATPITDNGHIVDIDLLVPKVYSKRTAELAIKVYERAYKIYECIGLSMESLQDIDATSTIEKYNEEYLPRKAKELFKIKTA